MRATLTDQFLWDLYNTLEKASDLVLPVRRGTTGLVTRRSVFEIYRRKTNRRQFYNLIYYLKKHHFIQVKELQGKSAILLTKEGEERAIHAKFKLEKSNSAKRKDGKWIMVIFDIPQKYGKSRNLLRSVLQNLGYQMYQQSVWVTPYDVSDKTEELLQWYSLEKFVKIFLIEKL